jgi:hypothetical protein
VPCWACSSAQSSELGVLDEAEEVRGVQRALAIELGGVAPGPAALQQGGLDSVLEGALGVDGGGGHGSGATIRRVGK